MDKNSMRLDRAVDVHTAAYLVSNVTLCFLLFGRYVCREPDRKFLGAGCIISEKALFANVLVLYVLFTDVIHMINVEKPFMSQEFCIT